MPESDVDRAAVKTYIPLEQKETWSEHADELDMSQSEFLRTMVQAGRRGFLSDVEEGGSPASNPGGDALEDRVLETVVENDVVSWDELVEKLSGDFEDRLDDALQSLTEAGRIRHNPRRGGYTLLEDS